MVRSKELNEAVAALKRLLSSEGPWPVHDERLHKAARKLEAMQKGETIARKEDLATIVRIVCEVLCEEVKRASQERR